MDMNIKIARELVRLARRIVAGSFIGIDRAESLVLSVLRENGINGEVFRNGGKLYCRIKRDVTPESPSIPESIRKSIIDHVSDRNLLGGYNDEKDIDEAIGLNGGGVEEIIQKELSNCSLVWMEFTFMENGGIHLSMADRYVDNYGLSVDVKTVESDFTSTPDDEKADEEDFKSWLNGQIGTANLGI